MDLDLLLQVNVDVKPDASTVECITDLRNLHLRVQESFLDEVFLDGQFRIPDHGVVNNLAFDQVEVFLQGGLSSLGNAGEVEVRQAWALGEADEQEHVETFNA